MLSSVLSLSVRPLCLPAVSPSSVLLLFSRAAIGRLQAASRRLQTELENEKDLQSKITAMLKESE